MCRPIPEAIINIRLQVMGTAKFFLGPVAALGKRLVPVWFCPIHYHCMVGEQWSGSGDLRNFWLIYRPWWRHQMETFSALLALCAGNSPVTGEFPAQRPVTTRSSDVFFDLHLNKRLSKQLWGWRFETPLRSLWCHRNVNGLTQD